MKPYLFTYSQLCPEWHAQGILNETNAVTTWLQPFPNAAIIISNLSARDLAAVLRARLGETWFLITELDSRVVDGLLPSNLWEFINRAPNSFVPTFSSYASNAVGLPAQPEARQS